MIKLIMFFVILEGFQTDSAKSSLGFLDDLSEGIEQFFQKKYLIRPHRRCRERVWTVRHFLDFFRYSVTKIYILRSGVPIVILDRFHTM